ncbi:MAG TPA: rRNA adenine methyltransferase [Chitinophagaceae bacterium]|nr:rRNA adenine methyltransferase [Chitinophagaceae bacterium]
MQFDPNNNIVKLCAEGMDLEGKGDAKEAHQMFQQAWEEASNNFEKFIAAHYLARHQSSVLDKLKWDETALQLALQIEDENMKANYPSLYLNIAKCYEDLKDFNKATENFKLAQIYTDNLHNDGYGNMIKSGIKNGIERTVSKL